MTTAMVKQELAVASFSTVYDLEQVETALNDLNESASDALRATYERMLKTGNLRFCVKPNRMPSFDALGEALPNFTEPLDDMRKQVALCLETDDRLELMPILLLGPPGIGKTHFAKALAQLLGTAYHYVPMSSLTAGWILSGASSQWKNAKPGKVFDALVNGSYANPVIAVDEIDKAGSDAQYDPLGALYALLEHDTARVRRRIRRGANQRGQRDLDRDRERRACDSRAAAEPDERVRDRAARRGRRAPHRADDLRRDPHVAWMGTALSRDARCRRARRARGDAAAHDAPRAAACVRRRAARRARRDRAGGHPRRRGRREAQADRLLSRRRRAAGHDVCVAGTRANRDVQSPCVPSTRERRETPWSRRIVW
jgi:energy-coupling factor transporter ATP-binding protein EcfA2